MSTPALAGRRVLVTAGPTWVRIDAVRHIGNLSSGRTGLTVARAAAECGAEVVLLLGPGRVSPAEADSAQMEIIEFVTFDDLHELVRTQVASHRFDAMVQTAAVSDYRPVAEERGKLSSAAEELVIRLRRTPKIVDEVKELDPEILLVKFKLESGKTEAELLEIARQSRARSHADLLVANDLATMARGRHPAFLVDAGGLVARVETTAELAARLCREIELRVRDRPLRAGSAPSSE